MKTSESLKELAAALAKAQGEIQNAKKDSDNPFFKSKYSSLASILEACRKPLSNNGLSVSQWAEASEKEEVVITTRLLHSSGEWMEGTLTMPVLKQDAQAYGSAISYAKRYALAAAVGIASDDDDGDAASKAPPNTAKQVNQDAFDALDPTTKDWIVDHAKTIVHLHETKGDMLGYIEMQEFDTESKLALWSQLPSGVRSAIKHAQQVAALMKGKEKESA